MSTISYSVPHSFRAFPAIRLTLVSKRIHSTYEHLQKSDEFDAWLAGMKDHVGKAQIALRIDRAAKGNFGDCEPVGGGVRR